MQLHGQGGTAGVRGDARGYAMAALLVGMSVMAVLMGAALPVWNKQAQREREEEYLFRATEYARAIQKFQRRAGPGTLPPNFDVLVEGRFLRRKYKDPITNADFQPVYQTVAMPGQPGAGGGGATRPGVIAPGATSTAQSPQGSRTTSTTQSGQNGQSTRTTSTTSTSGTPTSGQGAPVPGAGVIGVVSKSKAKSIKIYNGRTSYDQWAVTYQDVKPGKGLPPDLLQALNATAAASGNVGGFGQPGQTGQGPAPFGQGGPPPFGQPGSSPFGQPQGASPFGRPGPQPGAAPFGTPGASPFGTPQTPPTGGTGGFTPAYPPPAAPGGGSIFGAPPRKVP